MKTTPFSGGSFRVSQAISNAAAQTEDAIVGAIADGDKLTAVTLGRRIGVFALLASARHRNAVSAGDSPTHFLECKNDTASCERESMKALRDANIHI